VIDKQEADDKVKLNLLAKANTKMSEEPKLWPTEDEVVFNSLNLVKAEAQKKVHPLSSGIFGVNGLNIFSQHSSSQNLVQSSTFAQAINNGENAIEDSEDWIKNLSE